MKKVNWIVVIAGALVGLAAVLLTALGNPANMGFCIACFLRDIAGACSLHGAAKVQYVRRNNRPCAGFFHNGAR